MQFCTWFISNVIKRSTDSFSVPTNSNFIIWNSIRNHRDKFSSIFYQAVGLKFKHVLFLTSRHLRLEPKHFKLNSWQVQIFKKNIHTLFLIAATTLKPLRGEVNYFFSKAAGLVRCFCYTVVQRKTSGELVTGAWLRKAQWCVGSQSGPIPQKSYRRAHCWTWIWKCHMVWYSTIQRITYSLCVVKKQMYS